MKKGERKKVFRPFKIFYEMNTLKTRFDVNEV